MYRVPLRLAVLAVTGLTLSGCIAKTALDVATLPVKVASKTVDVLTTSQSEADEKRGREIRKQEEERGRQLRLLEKRCRKGKPLPTDDCTSFQRR